MYPVGIDIGYSSVKVWCEHFNTMFPSVVGTPDSARFKLRGVDSFTFTIPGDGKWMVGEDAVNLSRQIQRREDRGWIESPEWYRLFIALLIMVNKNMPDKSDSNLVVTGLPVMFYGDAEKLKTMIDGQHIWSSDECEECISNISSRIIPQPFGTLIDECLDNDGKVKNAKIASGDIGIIDIGGKTTNILTASRLSEITRKTTGVNAGGWDMVRAIRDLASYSQSKDMRDAFDDLRDHQIAQVIRDKRIKLRGSFLDLSDVINNNIVKPFAERIVAEATQAWGSAASLDQIFITGGGSLMIGDAIKARFDHAVVVEDPVFANARGYWKLGKSSIMEK